MSTTTMTCYFFFTTHCIVSQFKLSFPTNKEMLLESHPTKINDTSKCFLWSDALFASIFLWFFSQLHCTVFSKIPDASSLSQAWGWPRVTSKWSQKMLVVVSRHVSMTATDVKLTFPRKNFINKIIIGNHSPLRRHVRCFGTYGVHTLQLHGFPETHKMPFCRWAPSSCQ